MGLGGEWVGSRAYFDCRIQADAELLKGRGDWEILHQFKMIKRGCVTNQQDAIYHSEYIAT